MSSSSLGSYGAGRCPSSVPTSRPYFGRDPARRSRDSPTGSPLLLGKCSAEEVSVVETAASCFPGKVVTARPSCRAGGLGTTGVGRPGPFPPTDGSDRSRALPEGRPGRCRQGPGRSQGCGNGKPDWRPEDTSVDRDETRKGRGSEPQGETPFPRPSLPGGARRVQTLRFHIRKDEHQRQGSVRTRGSPS